MPTASHGLPPSDGHSDSSANDPVLPEVRRLAAALLAQRWRLVTAESCTGGLIAAACTELAGSSDWFERGVVSYSNQAKTELLGVEAGLITRHGAVSLPVAQAMVQGALRQGPVEVALAVTGVAGPGGGSADKPVGTVCFGWALPGRVWTEQRWFAGDRSAVRAQTVQHALRELLRACAESGPQQQG